MKGKTCELCDGVGGYEVGGIVIHCGKCGGTGIVAEEPKGVEDEFIVIEIQKYAVKNAERVYPRIFKTIEQAQKHVNNSDSVFTKYRIVPLKLDQIHEADKKDKEIAELKAELDTVKRLVAAEIAEAVIKHAIGRYSPSHRFSPGGIVYPHASGDREEIIINPTKVIERPPVMVKENKSEPEKNVNVYNKALTDIQSLFIKESLHGYNMGLHISSFAKMIDRLKKP